MKIEITPQELIQLMASFRADTLAVARGIGSRGEDVGPGMFVTGTRTPDGPDFDTEAAKYIPPLTQSEAHAVNAPERDHKAQGYYHGLDVPAAPELTKISPDGLDKIRDSDHKEQGYYQSALDVPEGDASDPAAQSLPLVPLDNSATLPTLADPRSAAEITVTPPAKRTRKKKPEVAVVLNAVLDAIMPETPPATAVFGGVPVPPAPPAAVPVPPAPRTDTPPPPPALPGVPSATDVLTLSATGKFMNAAIDSIRAQRMTHEEVMSMLRTHGINNFAELKDNEEKIPAILAELK